MPDVTFAMSQLCKVLTEVVPGFLVIDKPAGLTSHDCVRRIRRVCKTRRVGHGGTLDPAATGVLPIALGSAARLLRFLPGDKIYKAVIQLGLHTSTNDLHGEILIRQGWSQEYKDTTIMHALAHFQGAIQQRPPQVSAIHINGERAYKKARRGEVVNLSPRLVTLYRLTLLEWDPGNGRLRVEIHCSSGTYIRSLARDLGELLGCGGCLAGLQRTEAAGFSLAQAIPLPNIDAMPLQPLSILSGLGHMPRLCLQESEQKCWCHGHCLTLQMSRIECPSTSLDETLTNSVVALTEDGRVLGIGLLAPDWVLHPKVVLNATG